MRKESFLLSWKCLTPAEKETVYLLVELDSDREIASYRNVSLACVAKTKSAIYKKFGLTDEPPYVKRVILRKMYKQNEQRGRLQWE